MNKKFLCGVAALIVAGSSQAAFADDAPAAAAAPTPEFTITGSAAVVSQYRFRGLTQSDNKPAVQASITVTDKSGFYVSMWGSSGAGNRIDDGTGVFYASPNNGTEIDVYGGYSKTLAGFTLDGGAYGYIYPNEPLANLYEIYGDVSKSYGPIGVKVGLNWAPKQHYFTAAGSEHHYSMYEYGELTYSPAKLPALTLHSHTGGGLDFVKEYIDYTAGVGYKWKSLTFDISAVGTNISKKDARSYVGTLGTPEITANAKTSIYRYGKAVPVFSITASF